MIRTQISLTEEQMRAAQREARRRHTSLAALVREALEELLAKSDAVGVRDRAAAAVGGFRSGTSTTSEEHDDTLAGEPRW